MHKMCECKVKLSQCSQCVAPFIVSTNMTKAMKDNCLVKSAAEFVQEALNTVGYASYTSGCLTHALQVRNRTSPSHFRCRQHLLNAVSSVSLQSVAMAVLLPDAIRTSSFFMKKLQGMAEIHKCKKAVKNN